jgi:sulfate transport system permease protein
VNTPPRLEVWGRRVLIGLVAGYAGVLVLAPVGGLIVGALQDGPGRVAAALASPEVLGAFGRTLQIAVISVAVHAVGGLILAWVLVRDSRFTGRRLLNGVLDLPFAVSPVVVGYMLLLLFGRQGWLAPVLSRLDLQVAFAFPGIVLATLFVTLPFMVRELQPVLAAMGTEPEQAAATLGASSWQTFWRVTFPVLRWGFIYGALLTFARALGEFGAVLVIGGGVQGRTETLTLYIFRALEERQYVEAYSAALLLGTFSLALVTGVEALRGRRR